MINADVTWSSTNKELPLKHALVTIGSMGPFVTIPLPSQTSDPTYRIGFHVPHCTTSLPRDPSLSLIQKFVDDQGPKFLSSDQNEQPNEPIKVKTSKWSQTFTMVTGIAGRFLIRMQDYQIWPAVFLVGDAAHVHSPAGGLGMNLAIQDAIALAEWLVWEIKGGAGLDQFAEQRREVAQRTISVSKMLMRWSMVLGRIPHWLYWVITLITSFPFVQRLVASELSGLRELKCPLRWMKL